MKISKEGKPALICALVGCCGWVFFAILFCHTDSPAADVLCIFSCIKTSHSHSTQTGNRNATDIRAIQYICFLYQFTFHLRSSIQWDFEPFMLSTTGRPVIQLFDFLAEENRSPGKPSFPHAGEQAAGLH